MKNVLSLLRNDLKEHADRNGKESAKRFFKEAILVYGVPTGTVVDIAKNIGKK